jgi:hypothetical protein
MPRSEPQGGVSLVFMGCGPAPASGLTLATPRLPSRPTGTTFTPEAQMTLEVILEVLFGAVVVAGVLLLLLVHLHRRLPLLVAAGLVAGVVVGILVWLPALGITWSLYGLTIVVRGKATIRDQFRLWGKLELEGGWARFFGALLTICVSLVLSALIGFPFWLGEKGEKRELEGGWARVIGALTICAGLLLAYVLSYVLYLLKNF